MRADADHLAALATVTGYSASGGLLDLIAGPDQILTFTKNWAQPASPARTRVSIGGPSWRRR